MSVYDFGGRRGNTPGVPAPVAASDAAKTEAKEPGIPVGSEVFLASEYYSPADAGMQVFKVLDHDQDTGQCRTVNVDTGALRIIDVDELVGVEPNSEAGEPQDQ